MSAFLEVWKDEGGRDTFQLDGDRVLIGKAPENDIDLQWDPRASRLHAVMQSYASTWAIRDVGSRNGTVVNGQRITGEYVLRPGDEIHIGQTRMVYRTLSRRQQTTTMAGVAPPELTRREREVLVALCRPVLSASLVTEAASLRSIAEQLVVSQSAVKKHLSALYDKFGLYGPDERKRGRLAGEAIRRGAVTLADL